MPAPCTRLLAIDLDGTIIDHHGKIHDADVAAIHAARDAGFVVTICTGRALIECGEVIQRLEQTDPVIVSGGALVACPTTHRTLERFPMDQALITSISQFLDDRGRPAVILKDAHAAGFDYLAVSRSGPGALDPASTWWFDHMKARVRHVEAVDLDSHPEHTIRIGAYQANTPIEDLAADLRREFGEAAAIQHFSGVLLPSERRAGNIQSVHIVELFDRRACKGQALERLAADLDIPMDRTVAIGDQTNDLSMIQRAGVGIAMGNAHDGIKAAARFVTRPVGEQGVAHAIGNLLSGTW